MNKLVILATLCAVCLSPASSSSETQQVTTPRKSRALLVGINRYANPEVNPVKGAEEDVAETAKFLQQVYDFAPSDIHTLTDSQSTRQNILDEFDKWLIKDTQPGDRVFFLFSGHGSNVRDVNGDEGEGPDGRDETIVPYDVRLVPPDKTENQILDDELNDLIGRLTGRLAVLVFDSCHSGTISRAPGRRPEEAGPRYLPAPEEWTARRVSTRGGGQSGGAYQVEEQQSKQLVSRNLRLVEERLNGVVAGIVVISAAQPNQLAYPVRLDDGGYRGALSHLFIEMLSQQKTLTVNELRARLTSQVAALQQQQKLKGRQQPAFEILSKYSLGDLPLFAGAQAQVEHELPVANPNSKLRVELRTNENKRQYRLGEDISYTVKTSAAGWLYLLVFSQENVATCIFPINNADSYRAAGTLRLPAQDTFEVKEPAGKDITIALLSSVKLNLGDKETMSWDEVFERLRSKRLRGYVNTRGVGTKKPGQPPAPTNSLDEADWQAASLVIETSAKTAGRQRPGQTGERAARVARFAQSPTVRNHVRSKS